MKKSAILLLLFCFSAAGQNSKFKFRKYIEDTPVSLTEKELYFNRLDEINKINTIRIRKNLQVAKQVKRYLSFKHLPETMGKAQFYFYFISKKLKKYNLPDELKYLAIIESDLNPKAISKVGAKGMWQFMPATGVEYGLYENKEVSLFFDPIASTDAACRYLRDLYKKFKDWELALAAYNCGPGRVSKAIRNNKEANFWKIKHLLPKETQTYVSSFLAVQYIFNFYSAHNIKPKSLIINPKDVQTWINRESISQSILYNTKKRKTIFEFLNPHLLTSTLPIRTRFYYFKEFPQKPVILYHE